MAQYFQIFIAILIASSCTHARRQKRGDDETEPGNLPIVEPETPGTFSTALGLGNILLMQWVPFPIDKYLYAVVNETSGYQMEQGELKISEFTKSRFPEVGLIFTVVPGDADFIYTTLDVPVIGIDALKTDRFFMNYLDVLYNMHEFYNHVELWAYLIEFQDVFWPVRDRVSMVFQPYIEEKLKSKQQASNSGSGTEDFVARPARSGRRPAHPNRRR